MTDNLLEFERRHLSNLLEAVQRCVYFLEAAGENLNWPLTAEALSAHKKDKQLFGALAAINERFAKLQDTLGAAMRHAMVLLSEPSDSFLRVLAFYEKVGVVESTTSWQLCRSARNLAAHDYETEYEAIAEHFNSLYELRPVLYRTAREFSRYCMSTLSVAPASNDFAGEFVSVVSAAKEPGTDP